MWNTATMSNLVSVLLSLLYYSTPKSIFNTAVRMMLLNISQIMSFQSWWEKNLMLLSLLVIWCTSQLRLHVSGPRLPVAEVIEKYEKLWVIYVQYIEYFSPLRVKGVVSLLFTMVALSFILWYKSTTTYFIVCNPPSLFPLNKLFWHQWDF